MLAAQEGVCYICKREPNGRKFCVDHNHKTGEVRGLLCYRCNYGLTWYSDDPERLAMAAFYVTAPPARAVIGSRIVPPKVKRRRRKKAGRRAA